MSVLKEFKLGEEGLRFMKEFLADGGTLSRFLLQYCSLKNGEVVTSLPSNVSIEEAKQFTTGGKLPVPEGGIIHFVAADGTRTTMVRVQVTKDHLAWIISEFLRESQRLCVFEDFIAGPTDPYLQSGDKRIRLLDDEVYYVLDKEFAVNEEKIVETIKEAKNAWRFFCAISSLSEKDMLAMRERTMTEGIMKTIAERAEMIAVGAYDGEGYVIWRKVP